VWNDPEHCASSRMQTSFSFTKEVLPPMNVVNSVKFVELT
jgi:hypothetical protein